MLWQVSTIHRRAKSGRAKPPMVELIDGDGDREEAYLKSPLLHSGKSPYCLEREWIASMLARDLGLPSAQVVPVQVTPELIQMAAAMSGGNNVNAESDQTLERILLNGPELLIGSISLGPGWSEWSQAATVSKSQLGIAAEIYFFDTMVQNWDRVIPNPNLLMNNGVYGMIDQEESFVHAVGTDAEREFTLLPWVEGGVTNDVGDFDEHPLWRGIKKHRNASFAAAAERWKDLPEATIRGYADDAVFNNWSGLVADKIEDYLLEAIENIDAVHMQIEANRCN